MNFKVFNIRLTKAFCQEDQARMNAFLDSVEVKLTSANFVTTGSTDYWSAVIFYSPKVTRKTQPESISSKEELSTDEHKIFNALRLWQKDLAQKNDWPSYSICHNSHLMAVAKSKPQSLVELGQVFGFGKARTEKYGEDILAVLNAL